MTTDIHHVMKQMQSQTVVCKLGLGGIGILLTILSSDFNIAIQLIIVVTT